MTAFDVAYVLAEYPRLATTFITGEIEEIERRGGRVQIISLNAPLSPPLGTSSGATSTVYLKPDRRALAQALATAFRRHPPAMVALLGTVITTAGTDVARLARRLVHLAAAARAVEVCRERDIRHLHAHFGQAPATIAWLAAEIGSMDAERDDRRWSWSMTIHGLDIEESAIVEKVASAAFTACATDFTRSQVLRLCPPDLWDRVHTVRCGIELDAFVPRPAVVGRPDPAVITTIGRLAPEKGQIILVDAVRALRDERGLSMRALVVGDGPLREDLERRLLAAGLDDAVELCGEIDPHRIPEMLAATDVFCITSFSEGLPVALMEAMAMGIPVVTTHISGIPELAKDGVTARTVAPADASALARAIADVLDHPEAAADRARSARRAVERLHRRQDTVDHLISLLRTAPGIRSDFATKASSTAEPPTGSVHH